MAAEKMQITIQLIKKPLFCWWGVGVFWGVVCLVWYFFLLEVEKYQCCTHPVAGLNVLFFLYSCFPSPYDENSFSKSCSVCKKMSKDFLLNIFIERLLTIF